MYFSMLRGNTKEMIEKKRQKAIELVNALFDSVEYDEKGLAISRVRTETEYGRDTVDVPVGSELMATVPLSHSVHISVSVPFYKIQQEIAERLQADEKAKKEET